MRGQMRLQEPTCLALLGRPREKTCFSGRRPPKPLLEMHFSSGGFQPVAASQRFIAAKAKAFLLGAPGPRAPRAQDGKDAKLRNCIEEADERGFVQDAVLRVAVDACCPWSIGQSTRVELHDVEEKRAMQEALDNLLASKAETQKEHDVLLDNLAAAAASGDVAQIKVARNAAKEGGVPMKEIARVFALHNNQAGV